MSDIDTEDKLNKFQSKLARAFAVRELKKNKNWNFFTDENKRAFIVKKAKEFLTEDYCNMSLDLPYQVKKKKIVDIFDKNDGGVSESASIESGFKI